MTFPLEQVSSHRDEEWLVKRIQCPLSRTAARASLSCPEFGFFSLFVSLTFLTQSLHPYKISMLKAVIYTERNMGGTRPFSHLQVWSSPCCISCVARNAIGCTGLICEPGIRSLLGELFSGKSQEAPGKHACSEWRES